jgi:hypothetical protein
LVRSDVAFVLLTIIFCCMDFVYHAMLASDSGKKASLYRWRTRKWLG